MKTFATFCSALALSATLSAQTPNQALDNFVGNIAAHRCIFEYSLTTDNNGPAVKSDGKVIIQDNCWMVSGMGVDIHCDGKSTWIVDAQSKELVIEQAEASAGALNPVTLLQSFDSSFVRTSVVSDGKRGVKAVLTPKDNPQIISVTVWIAADGSSLRKAQIKAKDGTVSDFAIPSFSFKGKTLDMSVFTFDEKSVPESYTVTDLR